MIQTRMHKTLASLGFLIAVAVGCFAQTEQVPSRIDTRLVVVDVLVSDAAGRPVTGLTSGQFDLAIDGARQPIDVFSAAADPISFGVVYDMHPTTSDRTRSIVETLRSFAKKLRRGEDMFVVAFDSRGMQPFDFVPRVEQLERHMQDPSHRRVRALYDAVYFASEKIEASRNAKRVLIILSDSADHNSRHSFTELQKRINSIRTEVYAVIVDENGEPRYKYKDATHNGEIRSLTWDSSPNDRAALMELSVKSGGAYFGNSRDEVLLLETCEQIALEMRAHYTLGFYAEGLDPRAHSIKIRLRNVPGSRRFVLSHRMSYSLTR